METNEIFSTSLLDIIFNNRNKDYGAYELRLNYPKRLFKSFLFTIIVVMLTIIIFSFNDVNHNLQQTKVNVDDIILGEIKEVNIKPLLPSVPKTQKIKTVQFTPPIITKDENVTTKLPTSEDFENSKIDGITQDGIIGEGIVSPIVVDSGSSTEIIEETDIILDRVEIDAMFPGGNYKWKEYLEKMLNGTNPSDNGAPDGNYTTITQFIVDVDGNISDVKTLTNYGYGMEEIAIKVIKNGPKWIPAIQNGKKVKAYRKQRITFSVIGE